VLVGDLSAVLADELLLASGFDAVALTHALAVYHPMRERMAVGQYLDVRGAGGDPVLARRAASLRGGSYTVEGPLLIGAALGDAPAGVVDVLRAYGGPLGEAFQLHDDLEDGDAPAGVSGATVRALAAEAVAALDRDVLGTEPTEALARLAGAMTR
jgi:geranylgeranyl diphosphate synthase type I